MRHTAQETATETRSEHERHPVSLERRSVVLGGKSGVKIQFVEKTRFFETRRIFLSLDYLPNKRSTDDLLLRATSLTHERRHPLPRTVDRNYDTAVSSHWHTQLPSFFQSKWQLRFFGSWHDVMPSGHFIKPGISATISRPLCIRHSAL